MKEQQRPKIRDRRGITTRKLRLIDLSITGEGQRNRSDTGPVDAEQLLKDIRQLERRGPLYEDIGKHRP